MKLSGAAGRVLVKALNHNINRAGVGICILIGEYSPHIESAAVDEMLIPYFKTWEHFSGDIYFPIPGGEDRYYEGGFMARGTAPIPH